MKIGVIAHLKYPIAEPFHGGLEMHTHLLVEQMMLRGHEVELFALDTSDAKFSVRQPPLRAVTMGQGIDLFDGSPGYDDHFVNRLHSYMEIMRMIRHGGFDVVHNNSLHFLPPATADTIPCPMLTVLHTPPFPSLQSGITLSKGVDDGQHFVAVSHALRKQWDPYSGGNCSVVHNGLSIDRWRYCSRSAEKTAVWVGRFCPEKGAEYAIAAAKLAGYRLYLAGSIYDRAYFNEKIAPELGDDVIYVGHQTHAQLSELIGRASVGLFTSTWDEPFGLVLTEMLACGTPIASFDSGAAGEIINKHCGRIVPKYDTEALAVAIHEAADLPRIQCRARVEIHFPVSKMIDGYEKHYYRLTGTEPVVAATPRLGAVA